MASQMVESVLKEAETHEAKKVTAVHLVIGELTFLNPDQLRFSFNVLVKDTILEGSKLYIKNKRGSVKCPNCGYEGVLKLKDDPMYHVPAPMLRCPECESVVEIIGGRECTIKRVKMIA